VSCYVSNTIRRHNINNKSCNDVFLSSQVCSSETHLTKYRLGGCANFQDSASTFEASCKVLDETMCESICLSFSNHLICLFSTSSMGSHDLINDSLHSQHEQ
jgi:hypothetical protein